MTVTRHVCAITAKKILLQRRFVLVCVLLFVIAVGPAHSNPAGHKRKGDDHDQSLCVFRYSHAARLALHANLLTGVAMYRLAS